MVHSYCYKIIYPYHHHIKYNTPIDYICDRQNTFGCDTLLVVEGKKKSNKTPNVFYGSKAKQFKKTGLTFTGVNSDNTIALKTIVI